MTSPAVAAKAILVSASVGVSTPTADWSIHVSKMPAEPARAIAIFDTGGSQNPDPMWLLDYKTIQVQVRGSVNDYTLAYGKMAAVKDVLLGMVARTVDGGRWDGVTGIGDILFLERDKNDWPLLAMNFRIIVEPDTNALTNREPL
jgi:hypothetical protein